MESMLDRKNNLIFLIILIFYLIYAGFYIYRTSFVIEGERHFVLFDDAMISMRYAKNLAEGHGLVWNPGEHPVEGYTNPLWVVFMSIFHLFPIPASKMSLPIQISGAIFLTINLYLIMLIASRLTENRLVPLLSVVLTALYMPLNNWGLQGMEVSLLTLMVSLAAWIAVRSLEKNEFTPWPYVILAVGTLVRIDMVVPYLCILGFLLIKKPKWLRSSLFWGFGLLAVFLISQTIFRLIYYEDILPNTYYLKVEGFPLVLRINRGLYVFTEYIVQMNWVLFVLPFLYLFFDHNQKSVLLALLVLAQIAYSIYVGGDAWEHQGGSNRYISISIPLFFILFAYSINQVVNAVAAFSKDRLFSHSAFINFGTVLIVLASMYNFNFFLRTAPRTIETWILKRQPIFVEANQEYLRIAYAINQFTTPEARLAVVSAGSIPYFTERPSIDLLGKNEKVIAHQPNHFPSSVKDIRPGHMKWDYNYSIGELKPDVIVQLWGDDNSAEKYLDNYYTVVEFDKMQFSVLSNSDEILWEVFE
jgi:hypothetical protein